jgi:hypothetical protein
MVGGTIGAGIGAAVGVAGGALYSFAKYDEYEKDIREMNYKANASRAAMRAQETFGRISSGKSFGGPDAEIGTYITDLNTQRNAINDVIKLGKNSEELNIQFKSNAQGLEFLRDKFVKASKNIDEFSTQSGGFGTALIEMLARVNNKGLNEQRRELERNIESYRKTKDALDRMEKSVRDVSITLSAVKIFTEKLEDIGSKFDILGRKINDFANISSPLSIQPNTPELTGVFGKAAAGSYFDINTFKSQTDLLYRSAPEFGMKEYADEIGTITRNLPNMLSEAVSEGVAGEDIVTSMRGKLGGSDDFSSASTIKRSIVSALEKMVEASAQQSQVFSQRVVNNRDEVVGELLKTSGVALGEFQKQEQVLIENTRKISGMWASRTQEIAKAEDQRLNIIKRGLEFEEQIQQMRSPGKIQPVEMVLERLTKMQTAISPQGFNVREIGQSLQNVSKKIFETQEELGKKSVLDEKGSTPFKALQEILNQSKLSAEGFRKALMGVQESADKMIMSYKQHIDLIQADKKLRFGFMANYIGGTFEEKQQALTTLQNTARIREGEDIRKFRPEDIRNIVQLAQQFGDSKAQIFGGITGNEFIEKIFQNWAKGANVGGLNELMGQVLTEYASPSKAGKREEDLFSQMGRWQALSSQAAEELRQVHATAAEQMGNAITTSSREAVDYFKRAIYEVRLNQERSSLSALETERGADQAKVKTVTDTINTKQFGGKSLKEWFPNWGSDEDYKQLMQSLGKNYKALPGMKEEFDYLYGDFAISREKNKDYIVSSRSVQKNNQLKMAKTLGLQDDAFNQGDALTILKQSRLGKLTENFDSDQLLQNLASELNKTSGGKPFEALDQIQVAWSKNLAERSKKIATDANKNIGEIDSPAAVEFYGMLNTFSLIVSSMQGTDKIFAKINESLAGVDKPINTLNKNILDLSESIRKAKEKIQRIDEDAILGGIQIEKPVTGPIGSPALVEPMARGGKLFAPRGTDTVPAMLTPGEFVINAKAARQNYGLLKRINSGETIYAEDGGLLSPLLTKMFRDKTKPYRQPEEDEQGAPLYMTLNQRLRAKRASKEINNKPLSDPTISTDGMFAAMSNPKYDKGIQPLPVVPDTHPRLARKSPSQNANEAVVLNNQSNNVFANDELRYATGAQRRSIHAYEDAYGRGWLPEGMTEVEFQSIPDHYYIQMLSNRQKSGKSGKTWINIPDYNRYPELKKYETDRFPSEAAPSDEMKQRYEELVGTKPGQSPTSAVSGALIAPNKPSQNIQSSTKPWDISKGFPYEYFSSNMERPQRPDELGLKPDFQPATTTTVGEPLLGLTKPKKTLNAAQLKYQADKKARARLRSENQAQLRERFLANKSEYVKNLLTREPKKFVRQPAKELTEAQKLQQEKFKESNNQFLLEQQAKREAEFEQARLKVQNNTLKFDRPQSARDRFIGQGPPTLKGKEAILAELDAALKKLDIEQRAQDNAARLRGLDADAMQGFRAAGMSVGEAKAAMQRREERSNLANTLANLKVELPKKQTQLEIQEEFGMKTFENMTGANKWKGIKAPERHGEKTRYISYKEPSRFATPTTEFRGVELKDKNMLRQGFTSTNQAAVLNAKEAAKKRQLEEFEARGAERRARLEALSVQAQTAKNKEKALTPLEKEQLKIEQFARAHKLPGLRELGTTIEFDKNIPVRGQYDMYANQIKLGIRITPRPTTGIHEYGHAIDYKYGTTDSRGYKYGISEMGGSVTMALINNKDLIKKVAEDYSRASGFKISGHLGDYRELFAFVMESDDKRLVKLKNSLIQGLPKKHSGGVVPGTGNVPIMAEGGEYVVSKDAAQALSRGGLVQYKQTGGMVKQENVGGVDGGALGGVLTDALARASAAFADSVRATFADSAKTVGDSITRAFSEVKIPAEIQVVGLDGLDKITSVFTEFISKSGNFVSDLGSQFTAFQGHVQTFEGAVGEFKSAMSQEIKISVQHNPITVIVDGKVQADATTVEKLVREAVGREIDNFKSKLLDFGGRAA